jgi:hypothetical protein
MRKYAVGDVVRYLTHQYDEAIHAPSLSLRSEYRIEELDEWTRSANDVIYLVKVLRQGDSTWWYDERSFEFAGARPPFCVGSLR